MSDMVIRNDGAEPLTVEIESETIGSVGFGQSARLEVVERTIKITHSDGRVERIDQRPSQIDTAVPTPAPFLTD